MHCPDGLFKGPLKSILEPSTHGRNPQHKCESQGLLRENPGPEVRKLFPCSTQLSTKFILLINVKMPTIVGILTFISMINTTPEKLKARNFFICQYLTYW